MALNKNDLVQLVKVAMTANASAPTAYSYNGQSFSYDELNSEAFKNMINSISFL